MRHGGTRCTGRLRRYRVRNLRLLAEKIELSRLVLNFAEIKNKKSLPREITRCRRAFELKRVSKSILTSDDRYRDLFFFYNNAVVNFRYHKRKRPGPEALQ